MIEYEPFKMWSMYPFLVRDISFLVDDKVSENEVTELLSGVKHEYIEKFFLIDIFHMKNKKTSYSYRFVFQSYYKTLTKEEIKPVEDTIFEILRNKGFEIR